MTIAAIERSAFSPANVVPGISHSLDKMLQFCVFSYADAHRYRLGVNYESLPVNAPRVKVNTYHRDGAADRYEHREGNDGYTQAGNLYRLLPKDEKQRLHAALAGAMHGVPRETVERQLGHFEKADPA
jgi:catalase